MSEILQLKQLHFVLKHWGANVTDNTLDAAEVEEVLEDASERAQDMDEIRRFVRDAAGPNLQARLMAARGWYGSEDGDRAFAIVSFYREWAEDQIVMGNEQWYGMKTEMALIDLTHYYTNASFVQWTSLWVKTCLLQWAFRSRGGDDTRHQPEILTYEQTYNEYIIAQFKDGKSHEYILERKTWESW